MVARHHDGHVRALRAIAEGRPVVRSGATPGELRGVRVVVSTLARWGAIETVPAEREPIPGCSDGFRVVRDSFARITDTGRELLLAIEAERASVLTATA